MAHLLSGWLDKSSSIWLASPPTSSSTLARSGLSPILSARSSRLKIMSFLLFLIREEGFPSG